MDIQVELPGVKLGVVEADDAQVIPVRVGLARVLDEVCVRRRSELTLESLADTDETRAVRAMFREWGMDPSKYRPSSEALLRRVVQGKGLYHVSNVVDIGNLGSIETGWPFGCYDRSRVHPPIVFRHGTLGESYEGVGRRTWHLAGRPILSDTEGPFGSPISDSTRSRITESTRKILIVIYAPAGAVDKSIDIAMAQLSERLSQFTGARVSHSGIYL